MSEQTITLTTEERQLLVDLLQNALQETRVEEHRTRILSFRELIVEKEKLLLAILEKLGRLAAEEVPSPYAAK